MDGWSADYPCLDGEIASEAAVTIERQRTLISDMFVLMINRLDEKDPKVKAVLLRAIAETPDTDEIPA